MTLVFSLVDGEFKVCGALSGIDLSQLRREWKWVAPNMGGLLKLNITGLGFLIRVSHTVSEKKTSCATKHNIL